MRNIRVLSRIFPNTPRPVEDFQRKYSGNLRIRLCRQCLIWIMIEGTALIFISTMPIDQDISAEGVFRMFYSIPSAPGILRGLSNSSRTAPLWSWRACWLPDLGLKPCRCHCIVVPFNYLPHPDNTTRSLGLSQPLSAVFPQIAQQLIES